MAPVRSDIRVNFDLAPVPAPGAEGFGLRADGSFSALIPADADVIFHRVLLPANVDADPSSSTVSNDGYMLAGFPGFGNKATGSVVPILDFQGLPLNFAKLRLLLVEIRPLVPLTDVRAAATITSSGVNLTASDVITPAAVPCIFVAALTGVEGQILIGADSNASLLNFIRYINHTGTPGVDYVGAEAHPSITADPAVLANVVTLRARVNGTASNNLTLTKTAASLTLSGSTFAGGEETGPRGIEGQVRVRLINVLPATGGADFTVTSPIILPFFVPDGWVPHSTGEIYIQFIPTSGLAIDMNAAVTLLLIGSNS